MRIEFSGSISAVREVEDAIRVSKKYTKGAFKKAVQHPVQGEEFPSRVLTEYYEVYPDLDVRDGAFWNLPAGVAFDWLFGDVPHIDVRFHYNYPLNQAMVVVSGGHSVVRELEKGIPGLALALTRVQPNGHKV